MSIRQIRIVALSSFLVFSLTALPMSAASRDAGSGRNRDVPQIVKTIKKLPKLVIKALADTMSVPKP
jgi:hypothetical protein